MKKYAMLLTALLVFPVMLMGQAKKPTIMVVPADVWCSENGYMTTYEYQGVETSTPDYEKAVQNDMELMNAITKVGALMADRGLPLKDLAATIRSVKQDAAEDAGVLAAVDEDAPPPQAVRSIASPMTPARIRFFIKSLQ